MKDLPQTLADHVQQFYSSESPEQWMQILGKDMHYHHGYFDKGSPTFELAMAAAIRNFFPHLKSGQRILDAGCGWGGPTALIAEELECDVVGITNSATQAEFCAKRGLNVRFADLEKVELDGTYDTAVMFESLDHIEDKLSLLRKLRRVAGTLLLRVNCTNQPDQMNRLVFGSSSCLVTPQILTVQLKAAGWNLNNLIHRRKASQPTFADWRNRVKKAYPESNPPGQIGVLLSYVEMALADWETFERNVPLVDIVAS